MSLEIDIRESICIHCENCMKVCPSAVFRKQSDRIYTDNQDRCIICGHCVDVCPVNAVVHSEFPKQKMHPLEGLSMPSSESLLNLIRKRRSVRVFEELPVPDEIINKIIEAGHLAPTGRNAQKIGFTLVTSPEKIVQVIDTVIAVYGDNLKLLRNVCVNMALKLLQSDKLQFIPLLERLIRSRKNGKDPILHGAGTLLLIHGPSNDKLAACDSNLAYQNASLMASCLGIGHFYTGFLYMAFLNDRKRRLSRLLGIEDDIYAGMALGIPAVKYYRYADRKPVKIDRIDN